MGNNQFTNGSGMRPMAAFFRALAIALVLPFSLSAQTPPVPSDYRIGVYYFAGWKATPKENPWDKIRPYPEREPLLGFYPEGNQTVMDAQVEWMHHWGIDFILFDWFWSTDNKTYLDHALQAYLSSKKRGAVKFALNWCTTSDTVPKDETNFLSMVDFWIKDYFPYDAYLTEQGKPVVEVFSPSDLNNAAKRLHTTSKAFLEMARAKAKAAGFPGIYFVAVAPAIEDYVNGLIAGDGYDAITAYGYSRGYSGIRDDRPLATSYSQLSDGYKENWVWMLAHSKLPYWIPTTAGWNKRPWGSNTPHDNCVSTPSTFQDHLRLAKAYLDANPQKTQKTMVIYAWNEWGEGGYIEPTKKYQYQYLESIYNVFRKH